MSLELFLKPYQSNLIFSERGAGRTFSSVRSVKK